MNGFSESDASYGLGAYIFLAPAVSLVMSASAAFAVHRLMRRAFRGVTAVLISIPIFSVIGAGLKIVCGIIGLMIAEFARTTR